MISPEENKSMHFHCAVVTGSYFQGEFGDQIFTLKDLRISSSEQQNVHHLTDLDIRDKNKLKNLNEWWTKQWDEVVVGKVKFGDLKTKKALKQKKIMQSWSLTLVKNKWAVKLLVKISTIPQMKLLLATTKCQWYQGRTASVWRSSRRSNEMLWSLCQPLITSLPINST